MEGLLQQRFLGSSGLFDYRSLLPSDGVMFLPCVFSGAYERREVVRRSVKLVIPPVVE